MNREDIKKEETRLSESITKAVNFRKAVKDAEYLKNMAHWEGLHWLLPDFSDNNPFLIKSDINHLKSAMGLRFASLFATDYVGEFSPLSPDDYDKITTIQIAYENEWRRLKMDEKIKHCIKLAGVLGEAYLVLNYDLEKIHGGSNKRMKGSPTAEVIPTTSVYVDPSATDYYNADYYVVKVRKTKEWLKRNKPEWLKKLKARQQDSESTTNGIDSGELFAGHDYTTEQNNIFMLDMIYEKTVKVSKDVDEEGNESKINIPSIKIHYMINDVLLETSEDYPFDFCPIFQLGWEEMEQSPYCIPLMRGLTTPQKVVNIIESAVNNMAIHYTVPTRLISSESGIDAKKMAKLSGAAGLVLEVDGEPSKAITDVRPQSIDSQLIAIKNEFVKNIFSYSGVEDAYVGNIGTAGNTVGGTDSAIGRATMIDVLPLTQIEKFVERVARGLMQYIIFYNKDEEYHARKLVDAKAERLEDKYSFSSLNFDDTFSTIDTEFNIDLSIKTQNNKKQQFETILRLYQLQNQYKDSTPLLNVLDAVKAAELDAFPDLFKRYKEMNEDAINEKAQLVMQILDISNVPKLDGSPLIDDETTQAAIVDIINDDGSLDTANEIFKTYEAYQQQVLQMEQEVDARRAEQLAQANAPQEQVNQPTEERQAILNQMLGSVANEQ